MDQTRPPIRPIPLKIAGIIGLLTASLYLAVLVGSEGLVNLPVAVGFLIIMASAGLSAWFADRATGRERRFAVSATVLFFALALFSSSSLFVLVYLTAAILASLGFLGVDRDRTEVSVDS